MTHKRSRTVVRKRTVENAPKVADHILFENLAIMSSGQKKRFRNIEIESDIPKFDGLAMM